MKHSIINYYYVYVVRVSVKYDIELLKYRKTFAIDVHHII